MRRAPPRIPYPILYAIIRASRSSSSSLPFFISFRTTLAPRFIPFPSGTLSFDTLRHRLLQVYKALDFVSNKPWNQHSVFAGLRITEGFIAKLPNGIDTYLQRPVDDEYSGTVEGTKTFLGRTVSYDALRARAGVPKSGWAGTAGLSGGQMQRLAV